MASLWSKTPQDSPKGDPDVADTGLADVGLPPPQPPASVPLGRPQLQRNQTQPPPPHQPPPPPAPQQIGNPNDSLSLLQLKRIVTEFPKTEPTSYAFVYKDTATFEEEVNEWFSYNESEYKRLDRAKETFQRKWRQFAGKTWLEADVSERASFVQQERDELASESLQRRGKGLQTILHISLGIWDETAGLVVHEQESRGKGTATADNGPSNISSKNTTSATEPQLEQMKAGIQLIAESGAITQLFRILQDAFERLWDDDFQEPRSLQDDISFIQDELDNVTTIVYVLIEGVRNDVEYHASARDAILGLQPGLVEYFIKTTARLRWDEANELPQTRTFLLFWKSILLVFGGTAEVDQIKTATDELANLKDDRSNVITASPLDYHIFRQEITSKYPAYTPPQPLIPLEPDNKSVLPPLPNRPSRANGANGIIPALNVNSSGASILHQPVHIATPAPSPPPSPPVGGKAGKKQNYQTNQNFPFMYPPLDSSSNSAGGKGLAGLQGLLVSRKWEGSDIPKSILEAGQLFANRMRMTRAMRQLWDERERFLKFERGWEDDEENDVDELDLDEILSNQSKQDEPTPAIQSVDYGPDLEVDATIKEKLDLVEDFYREAFPHLQSLTIVLLKAVLANVTALITQPIGTQQSFGPSFRSDANGRANGAGQGQNRQPESANVPLPNNVDLAELPIEEIEALRAREITAKAVSGILLMLLKWFKVSHILKFEYLNQLLLDSNYLPLVLKLFAHQDIDKVVDGKTDRCEMSFFAFCNSNSNNASIDLEPEDESDEDDAVPPPIKKHRELPLAVPELDDQLPALAFQEGKIEGRRTLPEVDELGYPINEAPSEPITDFSWRNFFSSINFLRIMQKICKNKAHRNLLLVQYKSSNILKKSLRVPQPELRLYTLKLFKNQVPYCGRKWRQGNMRVITAIYLHCRPELRDDWLAGSDVDAEVEEALPLEQALRALTHWHNIKRYPDQMGADTKLLEEEHDFFVRELERMELYDEVLGEGESMDGSIWEGSNNGW